MTSVLAMLVGGDLRSKGASDKIALLAERDSQVVLELFTGLFTSQGMVRMRCADALEKLTRKQPIHLHPYRQDLLALICSSEPKEVLWHVVQMSPRINWEKRLVDQVFKSLESCMASQSSIVKTSVMQALVDLTDQAPEMLDRVLMLIEYHTSSGTPAMRARGAKLIRRLTLRGSISQAEACLQ